MDELRDLLDAFTVLGEKPSRRRRWVNWIVWSLAFVSIAITLAYGALLASNWLTGWPPN